MRHSLLLACVIGTGSAAGAAEIPRVALSAQHRAVCKVGVGDVFPLASLPGGAQPLATGKRATVVVVYDAAAAESGWMTPTLLRDLNPDVTQRYAGRGVSMVGVCVGGPIARVEGLRQLADRDGAVMAAIGQGRLPRVYVLDAAGKIAWLDIEYSNSTRRELRASLEALAAPAAEAGPPDIQPAPPRG